MAGATQTLGPSSDLLRGPEGRRLLRMERFSYEALRSSARRAFGGCLGVERRRRTWQAAKSSGESPADFDPEISEWGNPARKGHPWLNP